MEEIIKKIYDYSLEEIMGERFGRYAKTIIQDRALPDVRDGLKPVQRRILYAMYRDHNTYDKAYKKSAKTVGNVMGYYHPHGDSSIYEALVRMSQWWKQNTVYVDMHGNNGSMDGDGAAAMRYTEARLAKISNELLKDIDKETIIWAPNYDDTLKEPTVLPAKFPNLLVNGSSGISAGYATNIPPHNLGEIIDATIKRIDSPNCYLETILEIVKGPDFPTGGIARGKNGLLDAYKTGRGKIIVQSKYEFVKTKGKDQIVISEIPYEVNKGALVKKIDDIRIDKKIEGIAEVRDESDLEHPETIVIDLKKDANQELIVNYLLKNTDLQVSYNFNMVAIVNRRPMTLGILEILDAYIAHQKEVIQKRTKFDLETAKARMHIVEGFLKMMSILDEVIKTIRASKDRSDATINLVKKFGFSELQADAIVKLQLYRLTNTDVTELEEEYKRLEMIVKGLEAILSDENRLKAVMKEELRAIKKEYATPRKTQIEDEIVEIKIDTTSMIPKEDCIVVVTKEGYVKRVTTRSYSASDDETALKEGDYLIGLYEMNTLDTILLFTDFGNYLYIPVYELPDLKWKELGKHISNIVKIEAGESIIASIPVYDFEEDHYITMFSKEGMVKRTKLSDFKVQRYSKPMTAMKLKEKDKIVSVTQNSGSDVLVITKRGYGLHYNTEEIPVVGVKGSGVKAITLKEDEVRSGLIFDESASYVTIFTNKNTGKRVKISEFEKTARARKGVLAVRDVKTNPYEILTAFVVDGHTMIGVKNKVEINSMKATELSIADRYSTGSTITREPILEVFKVAGLKRKNQLTESEIESQQEEIVDLEQIDEKIMTIHDFLDDFEA